MSRRVVDDGDKKETLDCNQGLPKPSRKIATKKIAVKRQDGSILRLKGKIVQVLEALLGNIKSGCTGLDFSRATTAFRFANHICDLRKLGIAIETVWEAAGDTHIGRYFLREPLTIVEGAAL